jgi:hypothetical protein
MSPVGGNLAFSMRITVDGSAGSGRSKEGRPTTESTASLAHVEIPLGCPSSSDSAKEHSHEA